MRIRKIIAVISILTLILIVSCSEKAEEPTVLKSYSIDNLDGMLAQEGVEFDSAVSADGNGSVRITTPESTTVRLYETGDLDIENARLIYKAMVHTEGVIGQAYLEMWCAFEGKGEFFSRGLHSLVTSDTDWKEIDTMFFLKSGENPDNIKLNLVINGSGTVWIDDIELVKNPL